MNQKLTLFYRPGACALAPHILLHWLKREHEAVNAPRNDEYRRIKPSGAVPALQFGDGSVLMQCNAILNHLAAEQGRRDFLGSEDIRQQAEVAKWAAFFTGDFQLRDLLHRHRLRQVPRLIDIRPLENGAVIRQQLQRNRVHGRRLEVAHVPWHLDHVHAVRRFHS